MRDLTQPVDPLTRRRRLKQSTITWAILAVVTGGLLLTMAVSGLAWTSDEARFLFWSSLGLFAFYLLWVAWGIKELRRTSQSARFDEDETGPRESH